MPPSTTSLLKMSNGLGKPMHSACEVITGSASSRLCFCSTPANFVRLGEANVFTGMPCSSKQCNGQCSDMQSIHRGQQSDMADLGFWLLGRGGLLALGLARRLVCALRDLTTLSPAVSGHQ